MHNSLVTLYIQCYVVFLRFEAHLYMGQINPNQVKLCWMCALDQWIANEHIRVFLLLPFSHLMLFKKHCRIGGMQF